MADVESAAAQHQAGPPRPQAPNLSPVEFDDMVMRGISAHGFGHPSGIETRVMATLQATQNGRGGVIAMPGGGAVRVNVPPVQDLLLLALEAIRTGLQTSRLNLIAVADLNRRFNEYVQQAAQQASTGSVERADTPGKPASGTIGMRPAETPGALTGD